LSSRKLDFANFRGLSVTGDPIYGKAAADKGKADLQHAHIIEANFSQD
jgi:hypothetical protein